MAKRVKKRLTNDQEFQIMKIVLDKFLWLGSLAMVYGIYLALVREEQGLGFAWGVSGVVIWILFLVMLVREYEVLR